MIIPITIASSSTNPKLPPGLAKISHDEIVLVELQGTLEVEYNHPSERDGKLVGKLKVEEATNKPTLRIGHHLLEGKIATLPKPLAVLIRSNTTSSAPSDRVYVHDQEGDAIMNHIDTVTANWNVVAIVKRKIVFYKRPMPIVGRPT
ncbi:chromosome transmission fidelity protein 8 [Collybia nuda]|uniref:Chromosome transmission fidelity protein 8 n=1 Tax=Collybia nuda TaxID=64659 RepID=A0A9P5YFB7_9AGAR|nr:chromosome transmission fidelity protein 8 [Collybia nuda]